MKKLIVLILVVACIFYITNKTCQISGKSFYTERINNGKIKPKVYDIAHRYLPNYANTNLDFYIKDLFVLFGTLLPFIFHGKLEPFKVYLGMYIVIILLRCITINATILPKTKTDTMIDKGSYDKIFSGHFATLFLATLVFYQFKIITNVPLLVLANIINATIILSTRSHYTVDILVSIMATLLVFTNKISAY